MKAKTLLVIAVLVVLCAACTEAVAAPEPTPTPVATPTLASTPDPLWMSARDELMDNLGACLVDATHIRVRLLTGPVVVAKLIFAGESLRFHTLKVGVEKDEVVYETFVVDAEKDLTRFESVSIYIRIGTREWEFGFPVEFCP